MQVQMFLSTIAYYALEIYSYLIIGYVLMSWFPNARESSIGQFIGRIVEPYLSVFRRFIPPIGGMLDLSPILAFIALRYVKVGIMAIIEMVVRF